MKSADLGSLGNMRSPFVTKKEKGRKAEFVYYQSRVVVSVDRKKIVLIIELHGSVIMFLISFAFNGMRQQKLKVTIKFNFVVC